jgi:MFS family permease
LSIVSTAAPRIGAALRVPATAIGLVITAYLTTLAVLIPLSGWSVSRFGTRRVFLFDLRTLRIATFRLAVTSGSLSFMAIGAVPFLLPLLFETVFGWSAIKSGAIVLFVFVGNIGIKPATSYLLNRFGFRTVLLANKQGGERAGLTHILASAH